MRPPNHNSGYIILTVILVVVLFYVLKSNPRTNFTKISEIEEKEATVLIKTNEDVLKELEGNWVGEWSKGNMLQIYFNGNGGGTATIPGHSNGSIKVRWEGEHLVVDIHRRDGIYQAVVLVFENPSRLVGHYVHFNVDKLTLAYLERSTE